MFWPADGWQLRPIDRKHELFCINYFIQDIARFFAPLRPVEIVIGVNDDGRKSGEADVDFATHEDACDSMKKDKSNMGEWLDSLWKNQWDVWKWT